MTTNKQKSDDAAPSEAIARAAQPLESASAGTDKTDPTAEGETILVVEDNPDVRSLIVRILRRLHYHVLDAESGYPALSVLDENPGVDLLLCDVELPKGMSGPGLSLAAQKRHPRLKVLLMSGHGEQFVFQENPDVRHLQLIRKPFERAHLANLLRQVLEG